MSEHLPVLQVVIPLLCAPLALLVRREAAVRTLAFAAAAASFAISVALLVSVLADGPISYPLGGWYPPLGIEYRVDTLSAFVLCVVSGVAAVLLPLGPGRGGHGLPSGRLHWFYAALLLAQAGLLGVTITGDLFNVFVFLEISSLASYVLVGLGSDRRALRAAFTYLVMGTIGGTFVLIGIGFAYQMTGTLNLDDLAQRLPEVRHKSTMLAAFAFLSVGVSLKLAVFPLHQWLPNAYAYAPPVVSAFLAATATKVAYYLLARLVFTVFGVAYVFGELGLGWLLFPLSLAAIFAGALAAIRQTDVKKLLAYSSVSQIGYLTLGLSFASLSGLTGGLVHLFNHALTKGGLFLAVACVVARSGSSRLDDWRGIGRRMPWTMAAFVAGGLGLIGVPGTAGFVSKWYLVQAALEAGRAELALGILASSLLAVVYVWRVVETAYFRDPGGPETRAEAPLSLLGPTWVLIGASLYFGVFTEWSAGVASKAAAMLLGVGP
ncbi:MAG: monovalent cation/H+ antiporter subunit D family protein [Proteobacteria bacterium]|nr:monovalent cation/H+ antiporter subunit D family protein [Pseudomonadota bacterium]